jgi:NAD(P)-dependent dehydrogenase (short-subunit alcohol dehydrogenase family)
MKKSTAAVALTLAGVATTLAVLKYRKQPSDLTGQVALITGGSRGLGFILAREFAREGCDIAICARDTEELEQARIELAKEGRAVLALPCDVSNQEDVVRLVDAATKHFGRVDILVNNAGVIQAAALKAVTLQDFVDSHAVMFWGMLYATFAVLPQMRARRSGRIVNITSIGGKASIPHLLPYSSAKFAAVGLSEGLRAELLHEGITVTTIIPGLMRTGSYLKALFKGNEAKEFTWFALSDNLPFLSMDAERAARLIIEATKRGEAERIISIPATILARAYGLFPGVTTDLLGIVARLLLPKAEGVDQHAVPGKVARKQIPLIRRKILDMFTILGRRAAVRFQR